MTAIQPNAFIVCTPNIAWQFQANKVRSLNISKSNLHQRSFSDSAPVAAEIHLTSSCNLRCVHCSYMNRNWKNSLLLPEEVVPLVDWCDKRGTDSIVFSGGGEPLTWPYWKHLLEYFKKNRTSLLLSLATNGVLLKDIFSPDNLNNFSIFQISIYGFDPNSFLKRTGGREFEKLIRSIDYLFSFKQPNLQITAKLLIDDSNWDQWGKLATFATQWPFDAIVTKIAGHFEGPDGVAISIPQISSLMSEITSFKWPEHLTTSINNMNFQDLDFDSRSAPQCHTTIQGLYLLVRSDGTLFPCVASADDINASLGSIKDKTIDELWFKWKHAHALDYLSYKYQNGLCKTLVCRHIAYNNIIESSLYSTNCSIKRKLPML